MSKISDDDKKKLSKDDLEKVLYVEKMEEMILNSKKAAQILASSIEFPPNGICIHELEKALVEKALEETKWNQTRAAKLLGLTRDELRYRMQNFNLLPE